MIKLLVNFSITFSLLLIEIISQTNILCIFNKICDIVQIVYLLLILHFAIIIFITNYSICLKFDVLIYSPRLESVV